METAILSLLPGGDRVEILIVNDGSADATAQIADDYARRYPDIIKVIHKVNGGHGDAVMAGLAQAEGLYFKVLDSDDWVDADAYPKVLDVLEQFSGETEPLDMLVCNYVYEKTGARHRHRMSYRHALPTGRCFGWKDTRRFRKGQYLLMHSVIQRTELLRTCGLRLPRHTFYVDELLVYVPLQYVERMYYLDADFYHYLIGREGQSVQEAIMIRRIDQALKVNRMLVSDADPFAVSDLRKRNYMLHYLEIVTTTSMVLLTKSGTKENLQKKKDLWAYLEQENPNVYRALKNRFIGRLLCLPGKTGRPILLSGYWISRKIFGFN